MFDWHAGKGQFMTTGASPLTSVYDGWDTYQLSLAHAIAPLSPQQLAYRPTPELRSVGEIASHISLGRIGWFERMQAPGSEELARQAEGWEAEQAIIQNAAELVRRLEVTWQMVENTLTQWTVGDLAQTYLHPYGGKRTPSRASGPSGAFWPTTSITVVSSPCCLACRASRSPSLAL